MATGLPATRESRRALAELLEGDGSGQTRHRSAPVRKRRGRAHDTPGIPAAERLLEAALVAFAQRGFHGTTTREIAEIAEVSPAGIYTHYASKEELLYAICRVAHSALLDDVRAAFSSTADAVERVRNIAAAHASFHARWQTAARVANYELQALTDDRRAELIGVRDTTQDLVRTALQVALDEGGLNVADLNLATIAILSLGIDVSRWFSDSGRLTPEQLGEGYADMVLKMLGVASAASAMPQA